MGFIYDTHGRKTPVVIFLIVSSLAFSSFPFLKNEQEFYLAAVFLMTLPIVNTNPFVADLICKESHGIGNMLRSNSINLAHLTAYVLLMLNASYPELFSNDFIYYFAAIFAFIAFIIMFFEKKRFVKRTFM